MRKMLISLLAVAVLTEFAGPAFAQVPDVFLAMPPGNPSMSATAWPWCASTDASAPVRWFKYTWCPNGLEMCVQWVEFEANQGPIAKTVGLPAPAVQEKRDAGGVHVVTCDVESCMCSFSSTCFDYPFRWDNPAALQATNNGQSPDTLFEFCRHAEYRIRDILGLPMAYAEFMALDECDAPEGMFNGMGDCRPGIQFSVGGSVCVSTVFGSNGFAGQHNLSPMTGVGTSIWLNCTDGNGLEIRAGVTVIGGQQVFDTRR